MNRLSCLVAVMLSVLPGLAKAEDCYKSSIAAPSPFMGNNGEIFKLADGSVWEVKYEYEYLYEYSPVVVVCPSQGRLVVGKKTLNVRRISGPQKEADALPVNTQAGEWVLFEESTLEGTISGTVQRGRVFKTSSGNLYEVTGLTLQLVLELQPKVTVLRNGAVYKLVVVGFDEPLICKLLTPAKQTPSNAQPSSTPSLIETTIDDDFEGWDGDTIFKLSNGQIWEQASYAYVYHYAYRPKVLIYRSDSVYRMRVEDVDSTIVVRRLK